MYFSEIFSHVCGIGGGDNSKQNKTKPLRSQHCGRVGKAAAHSPGIPNGLCFLLMQLPTNTWESNRIWPKCLGTCHQEEAPGFGLAQSTMLKPQVSSLSRPPLTSFSLQLHFQTIQKLLCHCLPHFLHNNLSRNYNVYTELEKQRHLAKNCTLDVGVGGMKDMYP